MTTYLKFTQTPQIKQKKKKRKEKKKTKDNGQVNWGIGPASVAEIELQFFNGVFLFKSQVTI